jgi:hypothetical protein
MSKVKMVVTYGTPRQSSTLITYRNFPTQTDDDFSYVISYAGEENLVIGTDYAHGDTSSELNVIARFKAMEGLIRGSNGKFFPTIPDDSTGFEAS